MNPTALVGTPSGSQLPSEEGTPTPFSPFMHEGAGPRVEGLGGGEAVGSAEPTLVVSSPAGVSALIISKTKALAVPRTLRLH